MTPASVSRRLARAFAFARHVPPGQLLRRVELSVRRRWRDRFGWPAPAAGPTPRISASAPTPLFPPRKGMIAPGPTFTFLGRAQAMSGAVDWQAPSLAPQDQLWRMNLHYMEYLEEVDDAAFVRLIEDWLAANAPLRRGFWRDSWNAYALSLRVVVWMQQIARRRLPEAFLGRAAASLAEQMAFLTENLETDIGGNHLIKNIKALIWAGAFFEGEAGLGWRRLGLERLDAALKSQVLPDGVHYELSPSYHAQAFADLLECRRALPAREVPRALDVALAAMAQATADLAHPDGLAAQFNDAGLHMAYPPGECLDAYAALAGQRPSPRPAFAFPAAGYFGRRVGGGFLIVDCGRIGPDALPAHAHGDILSFEWSVAGERIVVDPGVYQYFVGSRRAAARSAASHNTLCFQGADQADFFGSFRCGRRPDVSVLRHEVRDGRFLLEGTHDGFAGVGRHVRRFEASEGRLEILDRIDAAPGRKAVVGFLLHPDVAVAPDGDALVLRRGAALIKMRSGVEIRVEEAVWSPDLGYERPTRRLRLDWPGGSGEIATVFDVETPSNVAVPGAQSPVG